jgi:hypothetical protein
MDRIKEYAIKKYPSKFKGKNVHVIEEENFFKVFVKDESPVFLSKNI